MRVCRRMYGVVGGLEEVVREELGRGEERKRGRERECRRHRGRSRGMKRRMSSSDGRRTRANEREEEEQVRSVSVAEGEERSIGLRKISIFERILSSCSLYSSASDRRMESSYFGNVEHRGTGASG